MSVYASQLVFDECTYTLELVKKFFLGWHFLTGFLCWLAHSEKRTADVSTAGKRAQVRDTRPSCTGRCVGCAQEHCCSNIQWRAEGSRSLLLVGGRTTLDLLTPDTRMSFFNRAAYVCRPLRREIHCSSCALTEEQTS